MTGAGRRVLAQVAVAAALSITGAGRGDDAIFTEVAAEVGLDFVHFNGMTGELYFSEMVGAGAALVDVDGDGDLDVYLVQGDMLEADKSPAEALFPPRHPLPLSDRLYRNQLVESGALRFTDVTAASGIGAGKGYGMGVATGDVDNDGHADLYVTNLGSNRLWRNAGDGTFDDVTAAAGADDARWSVSASFVDFDRDGWLDLYVVNYVDFRLGNHKPCFSRNSARDYCGPESYEAVADRLLRNAGRGSDGQVTFEDVTVAAGIAAARGPGLGVVAADLDRDGWLDLYVANDGSENFLWRNQGDGTFEETALLAGCAANLRGAFEAGMGVIAADTDDDGDVDLFLTHLDGETNTLYLNDGLGNFEDRTIASGLGSPSLPLTSFGTGWLDFDNDGRLDLLVASGAVTQLPQRVADGDPYPLDQANQLFRGLGDGRFEDVTERAGAAFAVAEVSRGVAIGDVDNDGAPDALIANNNGPARLLLNRGEPAHHWLGLRLVDSEADRDLYGARVTLHQPGGAIRHRHVRSDGGYASASDPRVLVGLGSAAEPVSIRVEWPDGSSEEFGPLEVDRYTTLVRGGGGLDETRLEPIPHPVVDDLEAAIAEQVRQSRAALAAIQADPEASPEKLGATFGELGLVYHVYEFHRAAAVCYRNARALAPKDVRWTYYLAHAYRETGDAELAAEAFERALEIRGETAPALVWLAQTNFDLGRVEAAQRHLRSALELVPDLAPAHGMLGDLALARRDFPAAVEHYRAALRRQPRASQLHYQLATAYRGLGDRESAEKHLRLRGQGKLAIPDPLLRQLQALNRSSKLRMQEGTDAFEQGQFEVAAASLRKALEIDPEDAVARVNLGAALVRLGRREEAAEELREALRHRPDYPTAHFNLAKLAADAGDEAVAIDHYRRAIAADPDFRDAHFNLANVLFRSGRPAAAIEHYARVRTLDPGNGVALRGEALSLARAGRFEEAHARLEEGHGRFPADPALTDALARLLAACPDDALRDGPRALELARANFEAERNLDHVETLAMAYAELGELDQAILWQQRAIEVADRAGEAELAAALTQTLEAYRRGEPSRRPWRD